MIRLICFLLTLAVTPALAQVARVLSVQGTVAVERGGQAPRILGTGDGLEQKDVVSVAQSSHGIVEFRDKTRVTLRPNTIFRVDNYSDTGEQSLVLGLSKGGFRAVSGDIAKASPTAMRVQTNTTVLGVRGTEFDARICDGDCAVEAPPPKPRAGPEVVARMIDMRGTVSAVQPPRPARFLTAGAALYPGETITTSPNAEAVIAFSDGSRVTLEQSSELAVERFVYDRSKPKAAQAILRLVSGNAHLWTGEIAKISPQAFRFETKAGTIEPHGTGVSAGGSGDSFFVYTWNGSVFVQGPDGKRFEVKQPNTLAMALVDGKITLLQVPPSFLSSTTLRPDGINIDPSTFGNASKDENGLYVWVRQGVVVLGTLEITAGNVGFAGASGLRLLNGVPNFLRFDTTPPASGKPAPFMLQIFRGRDGSTLNMCVAG